MQKKLIALAVAAVASSAAFAQSNVTIYGVVDAGYAYSFGGGHDAQHDILTAGLSGSRLGFKGVEDLGNGLKALFTLEYGVDVDANTGLGNSAAGARQQMVGLTGNFGTAVAGRLQTAGYDFACATSPIGGSALDAHNKVAVNGVAAAAPVLLTCGGAGRANNAFAYISPNFNGFTAAWNHARVTETAGAALPDDIYANLLTVDYAAGALKAKAVYSRIEATQALGADSSEWGVQASYNFGVASVFGNFQQRKITNTSTDEKWSLAVAVPVSAAGTVVAQYAGNSIDSTNLSNADSSAFTVAYTHALSKRTTAYGGFTYVDNESGATALAGLNGAPAVPGKNSGVLAAGLRHTF